MDYDRGHAITINNVQLPINVVRELQRLGRALEWYNHGELHSAVQACVLDGRLIDDPNGVNFMDQLELTDEENQKVLCKSHNKEENKEDTKELKTLKCIPDMIFSFCKRLGERRTKNVNDEEKCCA